MDAPKQARSLELVGRSRPSREVADAPGAQAQRIAGRYRIEAELGRGGMGVVYRALDEGKGCTVALKVFNTDNPELLLLFEREYKTLAKLQHPRVIQVYDYGFCEGGGRFYTMELLGGADIARAAPVAWSQLCEHLRDVCTSLSLLHALQLVHRDINPRNVRLDQHGRAKLIDFGALTPFGRADQVVGTLSCMAPEAARGEELDGRTDLFSLGVVAYWALTNQLPFAIGQINDVERAHQTLPKPPSHYTPGIPQALDALVLSLLSIDPMGRPPSAADMLDRLGAIADLDDAQLAAMAESHIASATLVGRETEQAALGQLAERAWRGHGVCLTIRGGTGIGKTRLLSELGTQAQLAGIPVLHIAGSEQQEPEALLLSVVRGLLEVAPHHTRASRALSSPELAGLLTRIGIIPAGEHISAPRSEPEFERTMRQHKAVAELVLEVARARSLMIAIDDAHLVHPVAAGVLTVLAVQFQRGSLLLACSVHSEQVAPPAVQQLALMGTDMTLEPLTQAAVELLVKSMFGAAPHRARLAQWLTTHAQGNPGKLLDLLRELVARRVLHYAGGSWALPSELDDTLLLQDSRELVGTRLARLSVQARDLAALLALQNGSLSEALCSELVPEHGARAALDELVREQLCVSDRAGYRLAQDGVRTLLLERLSEEHKRGMHQTLGTVLRRMNESVIKALQRARSTDLSTEQIVVGVAAGLHLLLGNETALGTRLLRNAAIALTLRGDGLTAAAADLEQGIATLRARGASRYVYVTLMAPLALAGNYADWRLSYRHGDETMATLAEVSGLSLARKLTPFVGGRVALFAGLALAFVQFMLLPQRRITNSFHEIFLGLLGVGSAVIGVCTALQHQARAREVGEKLAPLRHFPARHPLRMVHEFQRALLDYATGHYAEAHAKANAALVFVRSPEATAMIAESGRAQLEAGILIVLGQFDSLRCDGSALRTMAAAGELDTATAQQTLASTRVAYHGHRGERDALVRALEDMDQLAVKSGSIWRNDVGMPRMLWSTLTVCEDVLSLKRAVQQLDSLGGATSIVAQMRDTLHACYLSERGMAAEALARYEAMFQGFANETGLRAAQHAMVYARILRKAGLPERAEQICVRALAKLSRAEHEFTVVTVCLRRELAQALAALGQLQQATELVDVLLQEQTGHDNPLLHSLGHGSRAELALLQGDWTRFDTEIDAMRKWLQQCQHPALYAQCQRLVARAQRGGGAAPLPAGSLPQPETELLP